MTVSDKPQFPIQLVWLETGEVETYEDARDLLCNLEEFDSNNPADRNAAKLTDALGRPVSLVRCRQVRRGVCLPDSHGLPRRPAHWPTCSARKAMYPASSSPARGCLRAPVETAARRNDRPECDGQCWCRRTLTPVRAPAGYVFPAVPPPRLMPPNRDRR